MNFCCLVMYPPKLAKNKSLGPYLATYVYSNSEIIPVALGMWKNLHTFAVLPLFSLIKVAFSTGSCETLHKILLTNKHSCICVHFPPRQHLKDKFWNFIFYKFIFIFGVLNVQTVEEVVLWCLWFAVLIFLHLMVQLCKDRFEYVSICTTASETSFARI